ncbi:MAG TPA: photosynthetic reaction center cytochrome c subunit family protein [Blastocatellia bacterium]|nr:photosynthetic reaction center cytochrome c subunit family protein [Blastocatellia bacterium]
MKCGLRLLALTLFAIVGCCVAITPRPSAQNQRGAEPQEKTAEQVYRNVQVFKGLPASQLYPAMNFISGALGVTCAHCHIPNQFEKDDKTAKQTARRMIEMTRALDRSGFGDAQAVTCYTCHRGQARPASVPAITPAATPQPTASDAPPTIDQLLDKYVAALGGKEKLERITTLMMKGTETAAGLANNQAARTLEVYRKAPDRLLLVNAQGGNNSMRAFDGETGWQQFGGRAMGMSATDLGMIRREAQFDRNYNLRAQFTRMTGPGKARIGEREVWVIEATPVETRIGPMGLERELLYFDASTGLLARRQIEAKTALGRMPLAIDFNDYREVEGVKWPFIVQQLFPNFGVTQQFSEIRPNIALEEERFKRPTEK